MDVRLICTKTKEACIFCILDKRQRKNYLSNIKENVSTNEGEEDNLSESDSTKTVFSDYLSSYQVREFKRLLYNEKS